MEQVAGSAASARHANCFDVLRLFAALMVLGSHAAEHLGYPVLWLHGDGARYWFYDGVAIFFMISGALVYRSYERCVARGRPRREYFLNRFLRVAPGIYAYVLVTTIVLVCVGAVSIGQLGTPDFVAWVGANALLVPFSTELFAHVGTGAINASLWTIPAEVSFYLVVPLLFVVERFLGRRWFLGLLGLASAVSITLHAGLGRTSEQLQEAAAHTFVPPLVFFALGIFWLRMWDKAPKSGLLALLGVGIWAAVRPFNVLDVAFEPSQALFAEGSLNPLYCLAWAVPLSYAVFWFAYFGPRWLSRVPDRIGDLSYGVYIWHMPVINLVLYLGVPISLLGFGETRLVVAVAGTLGMAALSWHLVEKRALRLKPYQSRTSLVVPSEG